MLQALVESYAADMPAEVGQRLDRRRSARPAPSTIRFAWFGPTDRSQAHAYRVQGPTFLIEFNNTQNDANHIHSVWRNMLGDFGVPLGARNDGPGDGRRGRESTRHHVPRAGRAARIAASRSPCSTSASPASATSAPIAVPADGRSTSTSR